jgi:Tfp pilus assembly protein PilX
MNTHRHHSQRGSVLIVALIITAIIGISLASYIRLGLASQSISNRALYNNGAMNLAENGLEEAMYSINKMVADSTYNWSGWTNDTVNAWRRFPSTSGTYTFDQNATGFVRVYIYNYKGISAPKIVTRSTISLGGAASAPIEKWVEVQLSKTSKFANGLVAKNSILFRGNNATVDSWNSDPTNSGAFIPFSNAVKKDNGSVGSVSVNVDSVLVKNADVWGYVSTGGDDVTDNVGTNGSVLGADSAAKDKSGWTKATVDPDRISADFTSDLDPVEAPSTTAEDLGGISGNRTLPEAGDTPAADGKYYYTTTGINLNNKTLTIAAGKDVVLTANGDIKVGGGSGLIQIKTTGSLTIYTAHDVTIGGNGAANGTSAGASLTTTEAQQPLNFQIWGTSNTSQSIDIKGNGTLSAIVYAPNADVFVNGNGDVLGSVVAKNVTMVGNAAFHYDESLADFGTNSPYGISKWTELTTAASRLDYSGKLDW